MNCDVLCWFGSCNLVIYMWNVSMKRHWPLIKQKMTQAAQTASSDDSLDWESGHAGSATADNDNSAEGCCIIFQVLSEQLHAGEHSAGCRSSLLLQLRLTHAAVVQMGQENNEDYPVLSSSLRFWMQLLSNGYAFAQLKTVKSQDFFFFFFWRQGNIQ